MIADPSLSFWLRYAEQDGALVEPDGAASALVVLPDELRRRHDLPDELTLTADPDIAREDGATLVAPGNPLVDVAADRVLAGGDVGVCCLPWPTRVRPDRAAIEQQARDRFGVDHGRVDLVDLPRPVYLPVVRAGALLTYEVSLDTRFQERGEVWIDATTGLELDAHIVTVLEARLDATLQPTSRYSRLPADLPRAVANADHALRERAKARLSDLERDATASRDEELARAATYYDAAVTSIRRRQATATAERADLLEAQAEVTLVERERRVAEIHEKFRPRHTVHPYRLHLVLVPALRLALQVRRGPRAYDWHATRLLPAPAFTGSACPACGSRQPLVAGRKHLGCRGCIG